MKNMKIKGITEEDFTNYKKAAMFIAMPYCDFKCCKEAGNNICQNLPLANAKIIKVSDDKLIERYLNNPISTSIVFGGLEPFESFDELIEFIRKFRLGYKLNDDIVIYTGFTEREVLTQIETLKQFNNIIIKFGRFIPDTNKIYDEVLGVELYEPQYAKKIS